MESRGRRLGANRGLGLHQWLREAPEWEGAGEFSLPGYRGRWAVRENARVAPPGLGHFLFLPRTYVRGFALLPQRGWVLRFSSHRVTRKSSLDAHTVGCPLSCWFRVAKGIRRVISGGWGRRSVADRGLGSLSLLGEAPEWEGAGGIKVLNPEGAAGHPPKKEGGADAPPRQFGEASLPSSTSQSGPRRYPRCCGPRSGCRRFDP